MAFKRQMVTSALPVYKHKVKVITFQQFKTHSKLSTEYYLGQKLLNIDFKVTLSSSLVAGCNLNTPLIEGGISAGFPSPAEDFIDVSIDLNRDLIKSPASTFYGRVNGESMKDLGINDGDLIVIDKSLEPQDGKIAVCYIDGEFTLKTIKIENQKCWLIPANEDFQPIEVSEDNNFLVWGILVHVIKSY